MVPRKNDSTYNTLSHHRVSEKLDEWERLDDVKLVTEILQNEHLLQLCHPKRSSHTPFAWNLSSLNRMDHPRWRVCAVAVWH